MQLNTSAVAVLLDHCCKHQDMKFALRLEKEARDGQLTLNNSIFDPLLKLYAVQGEMQALSLFAEMHKSNIPISEGLCTSLLTRCAEGKFLRFAEEIVLHVRSTTGMT